MPRLPVEGSDPELWGGILNTYLLVGHNPDGSHVALVFARANHTGTQDVSTITGLTKTSVGLPNVDNTTDANKPVSTAQAAAIAAVASSTGDYVLKAGDTMTGNLTAPKIIFGTDGQIYVTGTTARFRNTADNDYLDIDVHNVAVRGGLSVAGTITSVIETAGGQVLICSVQGDTWYRMVIDNSGKILWGSGAAYGDTNLYRSAADVLKTDDSLIVGADLTVTGTTTLSGTIAGLSKASVGLDQVDNTPDGGKPVSAAQAAADAQKVSKSGDTMTGLLALPAGAAGAGGLTIGADTNLYRLAAGALKTDGVFRVGGSLYSVAFNATGAIAVARAANTDTAYYSYVGADVNGRFVARADGFLNWGNGTLAVDTNLYRLAASSLKTDGAFTVGALLNLAAGAANVGGLTIGADVNLYRQGADVLQTDDRFAISRAAGADASLGTLIVGDSNYRFTVYADGKLWWSNGAVTADTNLYRSAADTLTTDDKLRVLWNGTGYGLSIVNPTANSSGITVTLPTAGYAILDGRMTGDATARVALTADGKIYFSAGTGSLDTVLYRSAVNQLKTDGLMIVNGIFSAAGFAAVPTATPTSSAYSSYAVGDVQNRFSINASGFLRWGDGTVLGDATLYRSAAGVLKTDGVFRPGSFTTALRPTAAAAGVGGNVYDTTLSKPIWSDGTTWRDAAGVAV